MADAGGHLSLRRAPMMTHRWGDTGRDAAPPPRFQRRRSAFDLRLQCVAMAVFATLASLHAQSPTAFPPVRFTVFSAQPVKGVTFVPRANAAPVALAFQPTARSVRYEYRGAMPIRFLDTGIGSPVAEANIPPGIQNALLLFSPIDSAKAGAGGLRYQVAV